MKSLHVLLTEAARLLDMDMPALYIRQVFIQRNSSTPRTLCTIVARLLHTHIYTRQRCFSCSMFIGKVCVRYVDSSMRMHATGERIWRYFDGPQAAGVRGVGSVPPLACVNCAVQQRSTIVWLALVVVR